MGTSANVEKRGFRGGAPRILGSTLFNWAINVTNTIFFIRALFEKHEEVAVGESKEKVFLACWQ